MKELGIHEGRPARPATPGEAPYLSLVIPAFNEEARLGATIHEAIAFLSGKPYASELLLVLDGCTDGTRAVAKPFEGAHGTCLVRVLDNAHNRGKGFCVRQGMQAARGRYRFFTDADLSYPLPQLDRFLAVLVTDGGVAIASRDGSEAQYQRPLRRLVTYMSRLVMRWVFVPGVSDTQAGFKGFTAEVAADLFGCQRLNRFGFDAEVLHIAHARGYRIAPLPVEWVDVPGSKVDLKRDLPRMAFDLGVIVINRLIGRYRPPSLR